MAVVAVSTSAPIIAASTVSALAIAFWRAALGAGFTAPWALATRRAELRALSRGQWALCALGGVLLSAHFVAWIPSLRFTSVASSTALVATQPVWAALLARARGVKEPPAVWWGIGVALVGVVVLTGIDVSLDARALVGDALALLGAMLAAAYVTVGGQARQSIATANYTMIVYAVAALATVPVCVLAGAPLWGYPLGQWGLILALTLFAQLLGHSLFNATLRTTSVTVASLSILFEMPLATIFAAAWLGQWPPFAVLPALALVLAGLVLVVRAGVGTTDGSALSTPLE